MLPGASDQTAPGSDAVEVDGWVHGRLTALEEKLTWAEDLLDRLHEVVLRQQAEIDRLREAVLAQQRQAASDEPASVRSLRDDLPPHW